MTHRRDETTDAGRQSPRFITVLAEDADTVLAAQRLRYRVFHAADAAPEPHRRLDHQATDRGAIDHDAFDAYCEHLVVRDTATNDVVGTYRILMRNDPTDRGGRTRWAA